MTASALDFTTVIAFVLGAIVATVLLMMTVLRANANDARALRETIAARDADLATERVATATVQATIAQMKLGERDVEERLQRVAQTYVTEAREVLVKTAAERLVAQVTPLNERLDLLGKSLVDLGTARIEDQTRVATLLESLSTKMAGIDDATRRVERVLGHSQARGSWGEFELKRLLELTGMTEHRRGGPVSP